MTDWDDAYDNRGHIKNADAYIEKWTADALAFRKQLLGQGRAELDLAYGGKSREIMDLFYPQTKPHGLVIYIHGGYWKALDKSFWSHLAKGALHHGWAVCMPSYTLAPEARISEITRQISQAIEYASHKIAGPIRLIGHSAGGHLVTRMLCKDAQLVSSIKQRIAHTVSISGLHDLRPLLNTAMNETLQLNEAEAKSESPVFQTPALPCSLCCWVGGDERPEFLRQNELLKQAWGEIGAKITTHTQPEKHHFNVIEELGNPASTLVSELLQLSA